MILHYIHSSDPRTGGVLEAARNLDGELNRQGVPSMLCFDPKELHQGVTMVIAHGLWQWPGVAAYHEYLRTGTPYLVYPHGMLDPWFKKSNPIKHVKKQLYWWCKQGKILKRASAVCFTTEEERQLAKKTFIPYRCNEVVTGLGIPNPEGDVKKQLHLFQEKFPETLNKNVLLYMGRIHPKKGIDMLLEAFAKHASGQNLLVIAGPVEKDDECFRKLYLQSKSIRKNILWTDMLEGDIKWGAFHMADAFILPSHQENYGMVVAEACSMGVPILLTNKVNLWREVLEYDAGLIADDNQEGINQLVADWASGKTKGKNENARSCFKECLNVSNSVARLVSLTKEISQSTYS